jgi:hypothetical protein
MIEEKHIEKAFLLHDDSKHVLNSKEISKLLISYSKSKYNLKKVLLIQ